MASAFHSVRGAILGSAQQGAINTRSPAVKSGNQDPDKIWAGLSEP
jgi:hypothetical protein